MASIDISPLQQGLSFGVRIGGVTLDAARDPTIRQQIFAAFEDHGMIVFADVEPSNAMQLALSDIFGPLKEHPVKGIARVDADNLPGVVEIRNKANAGGVVETGGKRLSHWLPWHFDHCYNDELNRAGILRATEIVPEGGITGFADGIAIYRAFPEALRARIEGCEILYTLNLVYALNRFGMPKDLVELVEKPGARAVMEEAKAMPRAIHPAVWTRATGEKVLHVSPWMSEAIVGREDAEGDALLEEVCQTVNALAATHSYHHRWKADEMLIWDNWRMLHSVSGHDPAFGRTMQRTTIKGDYGLGRFEGERAGGALLEMTV
jgi:taurine dioxygenase